jgi:heme exporter protein C
MLIAIAMIIAGAYNALIKLPESPEPILKNNYRIVFFHVPSAATSFLAFTVTLISSILYLRKREYRWDVISSSSAQAGFFFITAALISGSIWARIAWGSYWNWDPRETTVLILWFAYAAYFALRASIENPEEKAKSSSILAIFAYATIPLSYLSTFVYFSLHPSTRDISIGLNTGAVLGMMITGFILMYISYFILDVKLSNFELKVREVD